MFKSCNLKRKDAETGPGGAAAAAAQVTGKALQHRVHPPGALGGLCWPVLKFEKAVSLNLIAN